MEVEGSGANPARVGQPAQPRELVDDGSTERRPHFRTALSRRVNIDLPGAADEMGDAGGAEGPRGGSGPISSPSRNGSLLPGRTLGGVMLSPTSDASVARIGFSEGALAGTELRLGAQGGRLVTAELLTVGGESRQALATVMDEMRWRLRGKGIALTVVAGRAPDNGTAGTGTAETTTAETTTAETRKGTTSRYPSGRQPR